MFNQFSQMMSEVNYRHDLFKQEVLRESRVRQAKQNNESKRQARVKGASGIKNGFLSFQKSL